MSIYFLDTSTFVGAYMDDEEGHDDAIRLLTSGDPLIGSELVRVEAAAAMRAAQRAGRVTSDVAADIVAEMESDTAPGGIVELIEFDGPTTLRHALQLVLDHPIYTLDALHLAVADREGRRWVEPHELVFATVDGRQRETARALGLAVL